jgi:parallel beta-helix repeat protein/predicted outer membrane repeat protein
MNITRERKMNKTVIIILSLLLVPSASAAERLVPSQYPTIQAAINAAVTGDTVIVASGTYIGVGNRDIDFKGKAITVRSEAGPESCIIDCNKLGRGFYFHSNETVGSIVDGFTIINGYNPYDSLGGGGIYCYRSSPTITNCNISGNQAKGGGGGIYCSVSNPTITSCNISGNQASGSGGGIYCYNNSNPAITNCNISGNTATYYDGGGICCYGGYGGAPMITNCSISGNRAFSSGGGIYTSGGSPTITNCNISGNTATLSGGGICCDNGKMPNIVNCTIAANSAGGSGGGIFCGSQFAVLLGNCILWANTDSSGMGEFTQIYVSIGLPMVTFSCIQDDNPNDAYIPFGGEGKHNIDDDPMFVRNPDDGGDGWGVGDNDDFGDLHLRSSSPCINTGCPTFVVGNQTDIDGQPRIAGGRIDMGADEFAQVIAVTKPAGGEVWSAGSTHEIKWSGYGAGAVDILFSRDDGGDWELIDGNVPDTGSYIWELAGSVDSEQCLVSVVPAVADANVVCIESGLFTIWPYHSRPCVPHGPGGLQKKQGPEVGCVEWWFEADGPVTTSVAIGQNKRIYVASEDGKLYALSPDGLLLWSYDVNSPLVASPSVTHHGTVYVGSENGRLYAIDRNGRLLWMHSTDGPIYSTPVISPDCDVYVCSLDGAIYALAQDGSELWSFRTAGFGEVGGSIFASPAIGVDGTVYIAGLYDPNLYALNPTDGSLKWVCSFEFPIDPCDPNSGTKASWPFASPVVAPDGTIYMTLLYDTHMYAIEPNAGAIIWSTDLADPCSGWFDAGYSKDYGNPDGWSEPVVAPDGTIYVSLDEDPYLRAVNHDGTIKWVTRLGIMSGFTLTVGRDGLIYVAGDDAVYNFWNYAAHRIIRSNSDDAHICEVDPRGKTIARLDSDYSLSFPVVAAEGTIIFNDANNTIWAVGQQDNCQAQEPVLHWTQDLNIDWAVDYLDLALFVVDWLDCTDSTCDYHGEEIYLKGDINRDLYVDFADFAELANRWLDEE